LFYSARDSWRIHLEGAQKLIALLHERLESAELILGNQSGLQDSSLHGYLMEHCLIYDILSFTRPSSRRSANTLRFHVLDPSVEAVQFASCPGPLIEVMVLALQQNRNLESDGPADLAIKQRLDAFDPSVWAASIKRLNSKDDFEARTRVGAAYKTGVTIFTARLSRLTVNNSQMSDLASRIISHLSRIAPEKALFKATCWPTFVAGAETYDLMERAWVIQRLHAYFSHFMYANARSAITLLHGIWEAADRHYATDTIGTEFNWIDEVEKMGADWLFV
ncbi:hypothetical protein LTS18_013940, partial [Coniosporium uncinatum]